MLSIQNLTVRRGDKDIFQNFSLDLAPGELVVLAGPNGVGKSTLALTLLGHPSCLIVAGSMLLDEVDLSTLKIHERAKAGLFLAHQEPPAIAGVSVTDALRAASDATRKSPYSTAEFFDKLRASLKRLNLPEEFTRRNLHEAFSGGEKKRLELLSLLVLEPKYAVLDEIDSGLDGAARELTVAIISELRQAGMGFLVISHNDSFAAALNPSREIVFGG